MTQDSDIEALLDVGKQIMTAAGCASLITIDESGLASSRPVRTFPSDEELTKITIPTDSNSRKTVQARSNSRVVLSYIDVPTRGYVTVIGNAVLNDRLEDKKTIWMDPFLAFWPDGPETESYLLIDVTPERIELRSFTQGVAEEPTRWTPVTLERTGTGGWQQIG
jgi:general stress protein 26